MPLIEFRARTNCNNWPELEPVIDGTPLSKLDHPTDQLYWWRAARALMEHPVGDSRIRVKVIKRGTFANTLSADVYRGDKLCASLCYGVGLEETLGKARLSLSLTAALYTQKAREILSLVEQLDNNPAACVDDDVDVLAESES